MIWVYPWKQGSKGAKALAESLEAKTIKHEGSRFKGHPNRVVINWGSSTLPDEALKSTVLNTPIRLNFMTNKLKFFKLVEKKARTVPWSDNIETARGWLRNGHIVVCRAVLSGHSGAGISIVQPGAELPVVPLYTRYVSKMSEFRIHIVGDEIVDIQRKAVRPNHDARRVDWRIRNLAGGFIYAREGVICPQDCREQALAAFKVSKLHFGAIDILWNQKLQKAYVLEVNTAPGLQGQTVLHYSVALKKLIEGLMDNG